MPLEQFRYQLYASDMLMMRCGPVLRTASSESTRLPPHVFGSYISGVRVVRPVISETTALGAAYAAGLAVGVWNDVESLRSQWKVDREWEPRWSTDQREAAYGGWKKAVERSFGWTNS